MKVRMKMQIYPARRRTYPVRRRISRARWRSSRGTEIASSRALDLVQSGDRVVRRPKQVRMLRRRNAAAQQSAPVHACGDLAAAPHMQLGEDAVNMILDRCVLDAQLARISLLERPCVIRETISCSRRVSALLSGPWLRSELMGATRLNSIPAMRGEQASSLRMAQCIAVTKS